MKKCILLILIPVLCFGRDDGAAFLKIGVGARALGMGSAFTAVVDDGTAFYWNPAGLALIKNRQAGFMYGPQFGSLKNPLGHYHYIGFTQPLRRKAVVSINWVRLLIDDIPLYSELMGNSYWDRFHDPSLRPTGETEGYINDVEDALFFSFSSNNNFLVDLGWSMHTVRIDFPLGVTIKWFRQKLGKGEASGLGIDLGAMCRIHLDDFLSNKNFGIFSIGLHLKDIAGSKLGWNTMHEDLIPPGVTWGFAYTHPMKLLKGSISISYDQETKDGKEKRFGLEYCGFGKFALRAGINDHKFCCGAGFRIWKINVDYAVLSHELDNLHRLSCSLNF